MIANVPLWLYQLRLDSFSKFMGNLTKRDLVVRISDETGLIQSEVFEVIQKTLDYITEALATGEDVELRKFGVFEVRLTRPRVGRNPRVPEKDVEIPARATVKFRAGKVMRQRVLMRTEELKNIPVKQGRRNKETVAEAGA